MFSVMVLVLVERANSASTVIHAIGDDNFLTSGFVTGFPTCARAKTQKSKKSEKSIFRGGEKKVDKKLKKVDAESKEKKKKVYRFGRKSGLVLLI